MYGNYIDEVVFGWVGSTYAHYAHDHLYSPAALIDQSDGAVLERCEYDAYGEPNILDADFSKDADGLSDYDNNYLFTGRRLDILDNGSLKIQYNRNRYYDHYTGRFTTHDPLGITPNAQRPNIFDIIGQYKDGINLYTYASDRPTMDLDPQALWTHDTHYFRTILWAYKENLMLAWAAERVGYWNNYVDTWKNPVTFNKETLGWHFDTGGVTELNPAWEPTDSRYCHTQDELQEAISICKSGKWEDRHEIAREALEHLGKALYPLQDWVAHGTWKPWTTMWHFPFHPSGTDRWGWDFKFAEDGILRDWDLYGGRPTMWPWGLFKRGNLRSKLTKERTIRYLNFFRNEIKGTKCFCPIYAINNRY